MKRVGLIGLGLLGTALAERLASRGFHMLGFDIRPERREAVTAMGLETVDRAEEVCRHCSIVLLSLPDSNIVADVMQALLPSLRNHTIIDTTTGDPEASAKLGQTLSKRGVEFLDATVVGSSEQTRAGDVTVLAGGTAAGFSDAVPVLAAFSSKQFHLGGWGSGATAKLIVNLVLGLNRAVLAEGLNLARACRMDLPQMLEVLQSGAAYSRIMDVKGRKMITEDFTPQARLDQHWKDVRLILELGQRVSAAVPLSELHEQLLRHASEIGCGALDNSAVIRAFEVPRGE